MGIREDFNKEIQRLAARKESGVRLCAVCKTPVYFDQIENLELRSAMQKDSRNTVYCREHSGTGKPSVEVGGDYQKPWAR